MNETFIHKWQSQVKKGTLSFILLTLLKGKEMYGYEIMEYVLKHIAIDIAEGTLYPLLNRLKTDGLIDSKWVEQPSGIPRKYYTLTSEGSIALEEMKKIWEHLYESIKKISK